MYIYLLRHANRKTNQCRPSEATIAKRLHLSRNMAAKHVRLLEESDLIVTEHTEIIMRRGIKKNGNLFYTLVPMHEVVERFYEQQFIALDSAAERHRVQAILSAQQGA